MVITHNKYERILTVIQYYERNFFSWMMPPTRPLKLLAMGVSHEVGFLHPFFELFGV